MTLHPLSLQNPKDRLLVLLLLFTLLYKVPVGAQQMIGIRGGYNTTGIDFQRNDDPKNISTIVNCSLLYTYYHPLWDHFHFFGIQTGISYSEQGFSMPSLYHPEELYDVTRYKVISIPVVSQFHIDFWKLRLLVNLGAFVGYRFGAQEWLFTEDREKVKQPYMYDCYDKRTDYGFIGGGGLAFKAKPFEIQFECNYNYSLSLLYNPRKVSNNSFIYVYPHQLVFSLALFFPLSK